MILSKTMPTYSLFVYEMMTCRNSIRNGTEFFLSMTKIPPDDILEGLYQLRIRESEKLKTELELHNFEIHQKKLGSDYHRLKTMVKRSIEQYSKTGILGPEAEIIKETPWSRIRGQNSVDKEFLEIVGNGKPTGSVLKETIAVSVAISISVQKRHSRIFRQHLPRSRVKNASTTRSPRSRSPSGRMFRLPCKDYLKGTCTNSFCEKWHPPECLFYKTKSGCRFGEKCSYRHVDEQPTKRSQKNGDKSAVAMLKITRHLGCVFQDMEPSKSTTILRKSSDIRKPIRRVKFTKAVVRHANIRDQNPSLGYFCRQIGATRCQA